MSWYYDAPQVWGENPASNEFESIRDVPPDGIWDYYERLREFGGAVWDDRAQAWLVTSYDLIKRIGLRSGEDWASFLVYQPRSPQFHLTEQEWNIFNNHGSAQTLMGSDGPDHDRMHRWFMRAFSPRVLEEWGDRLIEPIAHGEIDRFAHLGRAELAADYCDRVTPRVMAAVLGLPWKDDEFFRQVSVLRESSLELLGYSHTPWLNPSASLIGRALRSSHDLATLVRRSVDAKRGDLGDDFISMVWRDAEAFFGGNHFDVTDVAAAALNAFLGGTKTTGGAAGNALFLLMTHPRLQDALIAGGRASARAFTEESLRLYSSSHLIRRSAIHDAELADVRIRDGDALLVLTAAGSRDPAHYEQPSEVVLDRPAPRDHFGFFMGPRMCAGQSLARFIVERMIQVACVRLPNMHLDSASEPPRFGGTQQRHWRPLHTLFTVA